MENAGRHPSVTVLLDHRLLPQLSQLILRIGIRRMQQTQSLEHGCIEILVDHNGGGHIIRRLLWQRSQTLQHLSGWSRHKPDVVGILLNDFHASVPLLHDLINSAKL